MSHLPLFLSVVLVVRNESQSLEKVLGQLTDVVAPLVSDYEIVVVDNGSLDGSLDVLEGLVREDGLPNLQVYGLAKEVDTDTASCIGIENALGDFVAVIDPSLDDIGFLPRMLEHSTAGVDVVFANNQQRPRQRLAYRALSSAFNHAYLRLNGIHLERDAPQYRLLSRRVVNFILQHAGAAVAYRHLPATGGFSKVNLSYSSAPSGIPRRKLAESLDRGTRLIVSTTRAPMRLVTTLSMFGAMANLLYSIYVIAVALFADDVAPGWITTSLQLSGMFFLISLVLLVLGEYILHAVSASSGAPSYYVARELTSAVVSRRKRLNIEEAVPVPVQRGTAVPFGGIAGQ